MEAYNELLERIKSEYEAQSGHSADDVSDTGLRLRVFAGELYRLKAQLEWVKRQAFPQTATGEYLDRHGEERGVYRRGAKKAKGSITFARYIPISFDIIVPNGTVCLSSGSDPAEYETTEDGVIPAGELSVTIPAQAVIGGVQGNIGTGYVATLSSPPVGINYATNHAPFTGGGEAESDEEYRARVLSAYRSMNNGTNSGYYRAIALEQNGVTSAGVVPRINGAGTVGVYVWGDGAAPSNTVISNLSRKLNALREICTDVQVLPASEQTVNVNLRIKPASGADFDRTKENAEDGIRAFFNGLSVGDHVYLAELEKAVLDNAPVIKLSFGSTMYDYEGDQAKIPVLGTLTVGAIT